jgi:Flp pilus assembly protein TadB
MLTVAEWVQAAQGSRKGEPGSPSQPTSANARPWGLVRQSFNSGQLNLRRDQRNRCTAAVCKPKTAFAMIRFVFRFLGLLLLALAFIFLVYVLDQPVWLVLAVIAAILILLGRKKKPLIGYARD